MIPFRNYCLILLSVLCCVCGQLMMKTGMTEVGRLTLETLFSLATFSRILTTPFVLGGLFFYVVSMLSWFVVLSRVELSLAYPMLGLNYVLILLFSWLVLGEHITLVRTAGVLLIFLGVILISQSARVKVNTD
ncbi:MAG: EamA family transporter [Candidatus Omnitrophica bacterium]|nr:EamA family transporter [Candidatus Omnitrophota bacterium]